MCLNCFHSIFGWRGNNLLHSITLCPLSNITYICIYMRIFIYWALNFIPIHQRWTLLLFSIIFFTFLFCCFIIIDDFSFVIKFIDITLRIQNSVAVAHNCIPKILQFHLNRFFHTVNQLFSNLVEFFFQWLFNFHTIAYGVYLWPSSNLLRIFMQERSCLDSLLVCWSNWVLCFSIVLRILQVSRVEL